MKILGTIGFFLVLFILIGIGANLECGTLVVPSSAFRPYDYQTCCQANWTVGLGGLFLNQPYANTARFVAPVNLPNGVTIKKIMIYFTDNQAADLLYLGFGLGRANLSTGAWDFMATGNTDEPGPGNGRRSIALSSSQINFRTIKNTFFSYSIRVDIYPGFTGELHAIAITY